MAAPKPAAEYLIEVTENRSFVRNEDRHIEMSSEWRYGLHSYYMLQILLKSPGRLAHIAQFFPSPFQSQ